ncbi:MAG: type 1 glutamine amidotransferase [Oscillospiraceae bacterium]|nr:type 1 glutamine amidotransferase [Oscillospiraceae bacterium]
MKILMITEDRNDDSEVLYPFYRMQEQGWDVDVAALTKKTVASKYHFTVEANKSVAECNAADYDGLILPGGSAPEKLRLNADAVRLTKEIFAAGKPVCAICHGPQMLISADVVRGKKATCYPGIADDLKNAGALYEDAPVVVDGNLVTSRRPQDLPYWMREFVKLFK